MKKLPEDFLRGLSLRDVTYLDKPAVRIPYPDKEGQEAAARFRVSLDGTEKFRWRSGNQPLPYGLRLLGEARAAGFVVFVEGESDCHTLWYHEIPALGIPGVNNWRDGWAAHLDGIDKIYAVIESDQGGDTLREKLIDCEAIRERLYLLELGEHKDPNALHLADPNSFKERFEVALEDAKPWTELARAEAEAALHEAFRSCCETSAFRVCSQAWQFREELKEQGHGFPTEEVEDVLLGLARDLLPDMPAAKWDAGWAHELCKGALAHLAKCYAELSTADKEAVDLSGQGVWDERMHTAGLANDPVAFRVALEGWTRAGLEAMERSRIKGGVA